MAEIKLPSSLTVEEENVYSADDLYGDPVKKIITVKFGDEEVARYELMANVFGEFYYDDLSANSLHNLYRTPEEFVASKLRNIFKLVV